MTRLRDEALPVGSLRSTTISDATRGFCVSRQILRFAQSIAARSR
ncbi:MAG TPA: hypothetical protein VJV79_14215 [Polyangiaceae bacterium]|nr:hypothetical protein [Polyangiaceae bacterium]